jgi:hypothetical protein
MSGRLKTILQDVLLVGGVFAVLSGAYVGFAYAERYRALTAAYMTQSEQLIAILNRQVEELQKSTEED